MLGYQKWDLDKWKKKKALAVGCGTEFADPYALGRS